MESHTFFREKASHRHIAYEFKWEMDPIQETGLITPFVRTAQVGSYNNIDL